MSFQTSKNLDQGLIIKWAITIFVPLAIALIPSNAAFCGDIKLFAVVTALAICIMAFEFFNIMVISILLPVFYASTVSSFPAVFGGWTSTTPLMCIGTFVLANVFNEIGLAKRVAYWCILRCGGTYQGTLYGIVIAGIVLSFMTGGTASVLMAAFCYVICKAFDLKVGKESALLMVTGIVATSTTMMFVYRPIFMGPLLLQAQTVVPELNVTALTLLRDNLIFVPAVFLIVFLLIKIFKPVVPMSGKEFFQAEYTAMGKTTTVEKKGAAIAILLIIFMLTTPLTKIDMALGFIIIPWLLFLPGLRVGSEIAIRNINYEMVFFIIACLSIGTVAGQLGLAGMMTGFFTQILSGGSAITTIFTGYMIGFLLNFLMTPFAIITVFSAPLTEIAVNLGVNAKAILYAMYISCDQVIMPYEYPGYLLFYAFGMAKMGDFVKICSVKFVLVTIMLFVLVVPYWMLIGIL